MSNSLKKEPISIQGKPMFKSRIRFQDKTNCFFYCISIGIMQMLIRYKNHEIFNRIKAKLDLNMNSSTYWEKSHLEAFNFIFKTILTDAPDTVQALNWLSYYAASNEKNYKKSIANAGQVIVYSIMAKNQIPDFNDIDKIYRCIAEGLTIAIVVVVNGQEKSFYHPELEYGPILYLGAENYEYCLLFNDNMNTFDGNPSNNLYILDDPSLMYKSVGVKKASSVPVQLPFLKNQEPEVIKEEKIWKEAPNISLFEFNSRILETKIIELFKRFLSEEDIADLLDSMSAIDPRSPEKKKSIGEIQPFGFSGTVNIPQSNFNSGYSPGNNMNNLTSNFERVAPGTVIVGGSSNPSKIGLPQDPLNSGLPQSLPNNGLPQGLFKTGLQQGFPNSGLPQGIPNSGPMQSNFNTGLQQGIPNSGPMQSNFNTGLQQGYGLSQGPSNSGFPQGLQNTGLPQGPPPNSGFPQGFQNSGLPQGPPPNSGFPQGPQNSGLPQGPPPNNGFPQGPPNSGFQQNHFNYGNQQHK